MGDLLGRVGGGGFGSNGGVHHQWSARAESNLGQCGVLYGVAVYGFMYFIVLPRSAFPFKITFTPAVLAKRITIHIFCVGLPIALAVRWFAK
ncbi:MAG: hypothetical protein HZC38_03530 [Chloroflexi bacterium]|nr:hypothetical protein [Chloroflexota bacterium]